GIGSGGGCAGAEGSVHPVSTAASVAPAPIPASRRLNLIRRRYASFSASVMSSHIFVSLLGLQLSMNSSRLTTRNDVLLGWSVTAPTPSCGEPPHRGS